MANSPLYFAEQVDQNEGKLGMFSELSSKINAALKQADEVLGEYIPGYETAKSIVGNVVTLGGAAALDKSQARHAYHLEQYHRGELSFKHAKGELQTATELLGIRVLAGMQAIDSAQDLITRLSYQQIASTKVAPEQIRLPELNTVATLIADFNAVVHVSGSATSGVALSAGAWFLVAHLGIASTGTAIGTLSGAAAYSATLAWFGGGAIAAGGGGMALGGAVFSGILALPLIAWSSYKTYSTAEDFDKGTSDLYDASRANLKSESAMLELQPRITEQAQLVLEWTNRFTAKHEEVKARAFSLAVELRNDVIDLAKRLASPVLD